MTVDLGVVNTAIHVQFTAIIAINVFYMRLDIF